MSVGKYFTCNPRSQTSETGFMFQLRVVVRCITADAPKKAYLLFMKTHTSKEPCPYCLAFASRDMSKKGSRYKR